MKSLILVALSLFVTWPALGAAGANRDKLHDWLLLKVGNPRQIQLLPEPPLTGQEAAEIKRRIRNLAKISHPDFGLSPTLSGSAFTPIAEAREAGAMLLTSHDVQTSQDLVELVKLGPIALPFLLAAVDDSTPTKLVIQGNDGPGLIMFENELGANPANTNEQAVVDSAPERDWLPSGRPPSSYTVKIGDVCFVIIGQIVGRPYSAVRYQPSGIIVINSPPGEKSLVERVRRIWSHESASHFLLNSLLLDYATEAASDGESLDGFGQASRFQCGAAMRLLYYFPKQSTEFIAERLRKLDVRNGQDHAVDSNAQLKSYMQRERANGIGTLDFVKAVNWSRQPVVLKEVQGLFERTADAQIALATAETMNESRPELVLKRLTDFISEQPAEESGPFGDGYHLLTKLGELCRTNAKPAFLAYLQTDTLQRRRTMCRVLRETRGEWSIELLAPFLLDTRSANGWTYRVVPGQDEPRQQIRICDEAAETIAQNFRRLGFKMEGDHAQLDKQIAQMRNQISRHQY